ETADDVFSVAGRPAVVECDRCFYVGGPSTWTDRLQTLPTDVATVICVGHHPSMGMLASMIGGRRVAYETATTVIAGLEISDWTSVFHPDVTVEAKVLRPERS
ncbi:MAG: hypothetical protein OEV00_02140, partial [Acidobacteriota bacterium]|nr:hypothetical protein [Acidobacteriota bacterium]